MSALVRSCHSEEYYVVKKVLEWEGAHLHKQQGNAISSSSLTDFRDPTDALIQNDIKLLP